MLFSENRSLRLEITRMKEAQLKREQDHLDHIDWTNAECAAKEKEAQAKATKAEQELAEMKQEFNSKVRVEVQSAIEEKMSVFETPLDDDDKEEAQERLRSMVETHKKEMLEMNELHTSELKVKDKKRH
mmetsp:Transcript_20975/g.32519  ORF Transcript_20975/g.32519 Transcript_20975/m.32519 type:complete len:129 (+) Transcript_20975:552-938(+)